MDNFPTSNNWDAAATPPPPLSPSKQLNNSILHILDPIHQSLLFNNMKFDNNGSEADNSSTPDEQINQIFAKNHQDDVPGNPAKNNNNNKKVNININICQKEPPPVRLESGDQTSTSDSSEYQSVSSAETMTDDVPTTPAAQSSSPPMIHIIQEMTISRTITSTIQVNRAKIRSWSSQPNHDPKKNSHSSSSSTETSSCPSLDLSKVKKKCKQRIINENFCNEIIDKTIKTIERRRSANDDQTHSGAATTPITDSDLLVVGKLEAKCPRRKTRSAGGGHLLAKRLQQKQTLADEQLHVRIPPLKPPRTFAASTTGGTQPASPASSKLNSSNMSATTVAIGDLQCSPVAAAGGKLGWRIERPRQIDDFDWTINKTAVSPRKSKIGWAPDVVGRVDETQNILQMLNCDGIVPIQTMAAQPQSVATGESIDTVDSPPILHSKNMQRFQTSTVYSTPQKPKKQPADTMENTFDTPVATGLCHNCMGKMSKKRSSSSSFGKIALDRTKHFLESASKNILNRSGRNLRTFDDDENSNNGGDDEPQQMIETPSKSETTAQFNQDSAKNSTSKQTVKTLGLNTIESPKRVFEKFLSSVKRSPAKKIDDVPKTPADKFDFGRVVQSPSRNWKQLRTNLTPKRLFKHRRHSSSDSPAAAAAALAQPPTANTYRSYIESDDGFALFMTDYLRKLYRAEQSAAATESGVRRQRRQSMSSEYLDRLSLPTAVEQMVDVDCHPEPIYSEIESPPVVQPPIYASVDRRLKMKKSKSWTELSIDIDAPASASSSSSQQLDLVGSIQNYLDKLGVNRVNVMAAPPPMPAKRTEELLQRSSANRPESWDEIDEIYSRSIATSNGAAELTESIYDEVVRGRDINAEIQQSMLMVQDLDQSAAPQVQPESDDDDDVAVDQHFRQINSEGCSQRPHPPWSPKTYKQLKNTLRNSFRRSSMFFHGPRTDA